MYQLSGGFAVIDVINSNLHRSFNKLVTIRWRKSWLGTSGFFIPPANFACGGYTVFTLSVRACVRACVRPCLRPSVRPPVTFCFFDILKNHCWIFIKPCKHVHICKTNTLDKKVRTRGQFY